MYAIVPQRVGHVQWGCKAIGDLAACRHEHRAAGRCTRRAADNRGALTATACHQRSDRNTPKPGCGPTACMHGGISRHYPWLTGCATQAKCLSTRHQRCCAAAPSSSVTAAAIPLQAIPTIPPGRAGWASHRTQTAFRHPLAHSQAAPCGLKNQAEIRGADCGDECASRRHRRD